MSSYLLAWDDEGRGSMSILLFSHLTTNCSLIYNSRRDESYISNRNPK